MVLRWGICGLGLIAEDFANALNIAPDQHKVQAVASRGLEKAQAFAKKYDAIEAFGSYEELTTAANIDVIYVATLTHLHYDNVKMFLNAGRHVLCEKPICIKSEQVKELIELARSKNLFLMEGMWSRFFPVYQKLRETVTSGELGTIRLLNATFCAPAASVPRMAEKALGGGVFLDFGVYLVQLAFWVFGSERPLKVAASGCLFEEGGVDRSGSVTFIYPGDRLAVLTYSCDGSRSAEAVIVGEKTSAKIGPLVWCPVELTIGDKKFDFPNDTDKGRHKWNFWECGGFLYEANHVKKCLDEGRIESDVIPDKECIDIHTVMDEVLRQLGVSYP